MHLVVKLHAHVEHVSRAARVALVRPRYVAGVAVLRALLARAVRVLSGEARQLARLRVQRVAARAHVAVSGTGAGARAAVRPAAAALLILSECEAWPTDLARRLVVAALAASDGAAGRLATVVPARGAASLGGAPAGEQREGQERRREARRRHGATAA